VSTGRWAEPGVPHIGWRCTDIYDNDGDMQLCEMCQVAEIRYVHVMEHPTFPETLEVGCICAGHMEQDYAAAQDREKRVRRQSSQRARWLTRQWRTSRNGNPYLRLRDGFHLVVFPKHEGGWSARITRSDTAQSWQARRFYPTEEAAKLGAFNALAFIRSKLE